MGAVGLEDAETQTVAPRAARAQVGPARRPAPALGRGTCVGRYVILDRLGVGGMGVVYRAYDPDLDRRVALKLVRAVSAETTARLVREAQALAKVSHPNIVQIFDVGVFDDTVFIAMELVIGQTLWQWGRGTKPPWRVLLAHLIEAGRGLAGAHAAGLVHLDFKPQNAIIGADGRVRVLDFGLARLGQGRGEALGGAAVGSSPLPSVRTASPPDALAVDSSDTTTSLLDLPAIAADDDDDDDDAPDAAGAEGLPRIVVSRITGTPVYMAPEQHRPGVIDARADQFAFAVACWELLHGERPFQGETIKEYLEATVTGRFRTPPTGNETPAWVRRVLLRAMSAASEERYPSMSELLAALEADPARGRRKLLVITLTTLTAALATVAFVTRSAGPAPCADAARHLEGVWDPAVAARLEQAFRATGASFAADTSGKVRAALDRRGQAWIAMHREACLATEVREQSAALLDLRMSCLARRRDELRALVGQLVTSPDAARVAAAVEAVAQLPSLGACADRDALTTEVPLPDEPAKRAAIAASRSELSTIAALLWTGQWPEARGRAERAQTQARALGWSPLVAEAGLQRGFAEHQAGSFAAAEAALTETVLAAARAHLDDVSTQAWGELAWVVGYEQERPLEGLALASAAEAVALRAEASPRELAAVAHTRALIWSNKGDQAAALREAERALAILDKDPDAEGLDSVDVLNTIAMVRSAQGDYVPAEQAHRQALARRRAALGDGHPKVADSIDNLGVVRFHQGAFAEARQDYEQALAIRVAALGPEHRDVGTSHNNLGGLLMETGDEQGAARHLEAALRIYEHVLGPAHGDLAIPLSNLGELATRRGDHAQAIRYCQRALAIDESSGPDDPKLAYDLVCVGEAQLGLGALPAARVALERALALRAGTGGDLGELARTRFDLSRALWHGTPADQVRAKALASEAREGFAAAGAAWRHRLDDASAWLRNPS